MSSFRAFRVASRALASSRAVAPRAAAVRAAVATRAFSASSIKLGSGENDGALAAKLAEELKYENETAASNPTEPESVKAFKSEGIWTVEDTPGHDEVALTRDFGNEKIRVLFSIADINNQDETDYETEPAEGEEEEITPPPFSVRTNTTITKPGQGVITIDATIQEGAFTVDNVTFYGDSKLATDVSAEGDWKRRGLYIGPQFSNLDVGLQELFEQWLDERGINATLATVIPEYAETKEQKEYVQWLANVRKFIDA